MKHQPPKLNHLADRPTPTILGLPRQVMLLVAGLALASVIIDIGFELPEWTHLALNAFDLLLAICFMVDLALILLHAKDWRLALRQRWYEYALVGIFISALAAVFILSQSDQLEGLLEALHIDSATKLLITLTQIYILGSIFLRILQAQTQLLNLGIRPEYILVGSFAILILIGWLTLMLPRMTAAGEAPVSAIDALFTSTSASCVTGLVVRDTGTAFSGTGQFVIMVLFQIGGMGIITFVALISVASGRGLSVPQMVLLRDLISAKAVSDVKRNILGIVLITLVIEVVGIVLLYLSLPASIDRLERWEWSVFHAISAFCNAGFSLQADSLTGYQTNWGINLTCIGLIVIGGLGFPVVLDLLGLKLTSLKQVRRWRFMRSRHQSRKVSRLTLQTKLSLVTVGILIVTGTMGFAVLEWTNLLRHVGTSDRLLISLFQAVTPRTAGFNTIPIDQLQDATQVFLIIFMVIGAGPVSTGGGIKTVAFAVLLLTIRSMVAGRNQVEVFGRALPRKVIHAAISVFVIYIVTAVVIVFGLTITDPDMLLQGQIFEAISALSTVGLSAGITAELSTGGKLLIIVAMFVGRVGPLTLFLSVFESTAESKVYRYPEEDVVVS